VPGFVPVGNHFLNTQNSAISAPASHARRAQIDVLGITLVSRMCARELLHLAPTILDPSDEVAEVVGSQVPVVALVRAVARLTGRGVDAPRARRACGSWSRSCAQGVGRAQPDELWVGLGSLRFALFLDAMADSAHEEHERLRDWYGGPYNPDDIDERFTRRAVAAIAIRRHAGKLAYEKSRPQ